MLDPDERAGAIRASRIAIYVAADEGVSDRAPVEALADAHRADSEPLRAALVEVVGGEAAVALAVTPTIPSATGV